MALGWARKTLSRGIITVDETGDTLDTQEEPGHIRTSSYLSIFILLLLHNIAT
jgi:hypothetical protein